MWFIIAAVACVLAGMVYAAETHRKLNRSLDAIASELGLTRRDGKVSGQRRGVSFTLDTGREDGVSPLQAVLDALVENWWILLMLGSDDITSGGFMGTFLSAAAATALVWIAWASIQSVRSSIRLTITGAPRNLTAKPRTLESGLITGDAELDEAVFLDGNPIPTLARLDPVLRGRLIDSVSAGTELEDGTLTHRWKEDASPQTIAHEIDQAIRLMVEFGKTSSKFDRLAHRAVHDLNPTVRSRAAAAMLDAYPRHAKVIEARVALYDGRSCLEVLQDGSAAAIFALHELKETATLSDVPALVAACDSDDALVGERAEQALVALRHRTGGDVAGGVSLAQADQGGLSVASNPRSIVTTEPASPSS